MLLCFYNMAVPRFPPQTCEEIYFWQCFPYFRCILTLENNLCCLLSVHQKTQKFNGDGQLLAMFLFVLRWCYCVSEAGLQFKISLPHFPSCWGYRGVHSILRLPLGLLKQCTLVTSDPEMDALGVFFVEIWAGPSFVGSFRRLSVLILNLFGHVSCESLRVIAI